MKEYLESQVSFMQSLRLICRYLGIVAGVAAALAPFLIFYATNYWDEVYPDGPGLLVPLFWGMMLGFPAGMNLMFLGIALNGRRRDLNTLSNNLSNKDAFNAHLENYVNRIGVHRIVLIIVGAIAALQALWEIPNMILGATEDVASYWGGPSFFLVSGSIGLIHLYLAWVLNNQIQALKSLKIA